MNYRWTVSPSTCTILMQTEYFKIRNFGIEILQEAFSFIKFQLKTFKNYIQLDTDSARFLLPALIRSIYNIYIISCILYLKITATVPKDMDLINNHF
jgi:hypothetical protein